VRLRAATVLSHIADDAHDRHGLNELEHDASRAERVPLRNACRAKIVDDGRARSRPLAFTEVSATPQRLNAEG